MRKLSYILLMVTVVFLYTSAAATTITTTLGDLSFSPVLWENGVDSSFYIDAGIAGTLPSPVFLEDDWLDGTLGTAGFLFVADWYEGNVTLSLSYDYLGTTIEYFNNSPGGVFSYNGYFIWYIQVNFGPEITRLYAETTYGNITLSEEITRAPNNPGAVPIPAPILLLGTGLVGLAGFRKRQNR